VLPETQALESTRLTKRLAWQARLANPSRKLRFTLLFGSALALWIALFLVLPTHLAFNSDVNSYIGGAASLSAGHGYRFEQYIDLPPIRMYSPGYPMWLSLFWKDGQPISANSYRLEIANWLAAGAALVALAGCLFISELPAWFAATLVISFGTSAVFAELTVWLMSDILFTAGTCVLALLVAAYDSKKSDGRVTAWWLCASLVIGVLCWIKVAAVALAAGLGAYGLWNGDLRRPLRLACFVIPPASFVWWFLHSRVFLPSATPLNASQFGGLGLYALRSGLFAFLYASQRWLVSLLLSVPDRLPYAHAFHYAPVFGEALALVLAVVVFAIPIFLGIRRSPRQDKDRIAFFLIGAFMLELVLWAQYNGARLPMPLIPFVLPLLHRGLRSKTARIAFLTVLAVNIPGNAWMSYRLIRGREKESIQHLAELQQAAAWINTSAGMGTRVAAGRDVPLMHLYEYLGRGVLANAGPNAFMSREVSPAEQGNLRADYIVTKNSRKLPNQHYQIKRRFGYWMVLAPN
jgi:hypothetical protein